jgi:hypothetical protein
MWDHLTATLYMAMVLFMFIMMINIVVIIHVNNVVMLIEV